MFVISSVGLMIVFGSGDPHVPADGRDFSFTLENIFDEGHDIHDKWQATPNVTVDLGLRHEYYTPLVGLTGRGGPIDDLGHLRRLEHGGHSPGVSHA